MFLILLHKLRAFQVINCMPQDHILELEGLGFAVPRLYFIFRKSQPIHKFLVTLFKLVNHSGHFDALLSKKGDGVFEHPYLFTLLHV